MGKNAHTVIQIIQTNITLLRNIRKCQELIYKMYKSSEDGLVAELLPPLLSFIVWILFLFTFTCNILQNRVVHISYKTEQSAASCVEVQASYIEQQYFGIP